MPPVRSASRSTCRPWAAPIRFSNTAPNARTKYIPKLVSADYLGGFGITEPDAGSDVMAMQSTAEDKGDHWLLNGSKTWISNAHVADVLIYYAYTDRSKGSKGLSAFVVEPKTVNGVNTCNWTKWVRTHRRPAKSS